MANTQDALKQSACAVCYGTGFDVAGQRCPFGCRAALQPTEQPEYVPIDESEDTLADAVERGQDTYNPNPFKLKRKPAVQPEAAQDERERFETHYASLHDGFVPPFFDGEYDWHDAQNCWLTWQAAKRDAAQSKK